MSDLERLIKQMKYETWYRCPTGWIRTAKDLDLEGAETAVWYGRKHNPAAQFEVREQKDEPPSISGCDPQA